MIFAEALKAAFKVSAVQFADREQDRNISLRFRHSAISCDAIAHRVHKDRGGLRPAVCVLLDTVDARFI